MYVVVISYPIKLIEFLAMHLYILRCICIYARMHARMSTHVCMLTGICIYIYNYIYIHLRGSLQGFDPQASTSCIVARCCYVGLCGKKGHVLVCVAFPLITAACCQRVQYCCQLPV